MSTDFSGQSISRSGRPDPWTQAPDPLIESHWDEEYAYEERVSPSRWNLDDRQLAQALGWFSIGLGLAEVLAPRALGRAIGVGEHPAILRMLGVREIISGIGLLSERAPGSWAWSRVAGDAMDLALLGAAMRSPDAQPQRIAIAATTVLGAAALDVYASQRLMHAELDAPEIRVREVVAINSTPQVLYAFWSNVENLPLFMSHLQSVSKTGERTSHWVAKAPAGATIEWDSEIVDDEPNARIGWRTLPDSEITHEGIVRFEAATDDRGTIAHVELLYWPPAGKIGAALTHLLGEEPRKQINDDLRRLKQLLETGEVSTTLGQSSGRRSLIGRATLGRSMQ
ncbi:MAG: SRPBCC family protein [Steroidobacter sp.]